MAQATIQPVAQKAVPATKPVVVVQPGSSQQPGAVNPKKSKTWLWIVGIVVAFLIGFGIGFVL